LASVTGARPLEPHQPDRRLLVGGETNASKKAGSGHSESQPNLNVNVIYFPFRQTTNCEVSDCWNRLCIFGEKQTVIGSEPTSGATRERLRSVPNRLVRGGRDGIDESGVAYRAQADSESRNGFCWFSKDAVGRSLVRSHPNVRCEPGSVCAKGSRDASRSELALPGSPGRGQ
jgi:hypothetical protein